MTKFDLDRFGGKYGVVALVGVFCRIGFVRGCLLNGFGLFVIF